MDNCFSVAAIVLWLPSIAMPSNWPEVPRSTATVWAALIPVKLNCSVLLPPPITLKEPLSLKRIWLIEPCVIVPSLGSMVAAMPQTVGSVSLRV